MWKNIIFWTIATVLNSISFRLEAQDTAFTSSVVRWDLATAIAYAKQHNIQVNIVRLDERLSEPRKYEGGFRVGVNNRITKTNVERSKITVQAEFNEHS